MMSNIDWPSIQSHLQNDTLREHFTSSFTASSAVEAYVQYTQYFLSKYSNSSSDLPEVSVSLPVLRIFLLSVPSYVIRSVKCNSELMDWLKEVISSGSLHSIGNTLSILSILAKSLQSVEDLLQSMTTCFQVATHRVAECIRDWKEEYSLQVLIVVHQLEELLNIIGSHSSLPTRVVCLTVGDVAVLIDFLLSENCKTVPNSSKFTVDTMKLGAMILAVWVSHHKNMESVSSIVWNENAITVLQNVYDLTIKGDVTHDSLHTALHGAAEMLFVISHSQLEANAEAFEIRRNVLKQCCYYLVEADTQLSSVSQCNKIEALVGYISSFFESENQPQQQEALSRDMLPIVPSVVECIVTLQLKMKEKTTTAAAKSSTSRELKSLYSDIRKGSIATMTTVLGCCPQWIVNNQPAYWDLCLKSLMTPVLFTVGYRALSQDDAFLVRLLQYLHTALLAVPRYSASAADDIIQTIQDLIDSGRCYQLYSNSTSFDILAALLSTYALSPKPSGESNASETKLNWQISVVVTVNALLQMCKAQEGTHILTEEFFSSYFDKYVTDFIQQTSADASSSGAVSPKNKGKSADLKVELLHCTTLLLISLTEVCSVSMLSGVIRSSLLKLVVHLMSINSREAVFEEDAAQLSGEFDLLTKTVTLLAGDASSSKQYQHVILMAVISLCNVVCVKNDQEAELDLSLCSKTLLEGEQSAAVSAVTVLFEQLKCTYASSLSGQVQQKTLQVQSDVTYECVREAILNLTHHCTTLVAEERKEEVDELLHSVYESLPLEVDQLPALDSSVGGHLQNEAFKLSIKKSFTYDILCSIKAILL